MTDRDPRDPWPPIPQAKATSIDPSEIDLSRPFKFRAQVDILNQLFVRNTLQHINIEDTDDPGVFFIVDVNTGIGRLLWAFPDGTFLEAVHIGKDGVTTFRGLAGQVHFQIPILKAKVILTADETIADSSDVVIPWDSEVVDTGSFWAAGNPSRFTITHPGWYRVEAWVQWAANATGSRNLTLRRNGADVLQLNEEPAQSSNPRSQYISTFNVYVVGDYVELLAKQFSGGALSLIGGGARSNMSVTYEGTT